MFLGHFHYSLDTQCRLVVPPTFRDLIAKGAYITQGFDRNIMVLTQTAFQTLYQQLMSLSITDPVARLLIRMLLANASEVSVDENGCVLLPQMLCEFARCENEVAIVGQGDYFEVWSPALWNNQQMRLQDADANANRFASLDIAQI